MNRVSDRLSQIASTTIERQRLLAPSTTVIVAVSGGVDSIALLHYLAGRSDLDLRIVVAHLNHSLRGEESDADEALVRESAERFGATFESRKEDVRAIAREKGLSLEEAGRAARYRFFDELALMYEGAVVALAHHRDDQAETVLMRLLRGSGPAGLTGMGYCSRSGRYIRPFLDARRADIEAYAGQYGLAFRNDSSNSDTSFLRNRIRLELLPQLAGYNPSIVSRLADTAAIMAADEELLAGCVDVCWQGVARVDEGVVLLDCERLRKEPVGMRLRIFRHAILTLSGNLRRISYRHLQSMDRLVTCGPSNGSLDLPCNLRFERSYDTARVVRGRSGDRSEPFELSVSGAGSYDLPCGGRVRILPLSCSSAECSNGTLTLDVDLGIHPFPWTIRTFRPGDRLVPSGMTGRKKVKDLFIDGKIPRSVRASLPLFFSGPTLFWVAGLRSTASVTAFSGECDAVRVELLEFPHAPAILG